MKAISAQMLRETWNGYGDFYRITRQFYHFSILAIEKLSDNTLEGIKDTEWFPFRESSPFLGSGPKDLTYLCELSG